jgi:hypothetical protein
MRIAVQTEATISRFLVLGNKTKARPDGEKTPLLKEKGVKSSG